MNPPSNFRANNVTWKNDEFRKNGTASISSPEVLPTRQVDRAMVQILSLTKSTKESNVGSVEQLPQLKREQFQGYGENEYPHLLHSKNKKRVSIQVHGTKQELSCGY